MVSYCAGVQMVNRHLLLPIIRVGISEITHELMNLEEFNNLKKMSFILLGIIFGFTDLRVRIQ